jgi:uncharacterized protein (TIGR02996 family)
MPRHEAFLKAVIDAPDDDAPRLIYADWLEENGGAARAEFIRVQCEVANLPDGDPRKKLLKNRAAALLKSHRHIWDPPVFQALGRLASHDALPQEKWFLLLPLRQRISRVLSPSSARGALEYRRGFVGAVELGMREFLDQAEALFRIAPVQTIRFWSGSPERIPAILASPLLRRVRELELSAQELDDSDMVDLAGRAALGGLTSLNLSYNRIGPSGAVALCTSPCLTGLQELVLSMNPIGNAGARALADLPLLGGLQLIDLSECGISRRLAEALRLRHRQTHIFV